MNKVSLMGRLVKDVEVDYTKSGLAVTTFTIACQRPKKKDEKKSDADFIRCKAFGKTAETIGNFFSKGQRILISDGSIHTDSYENKEGNKVYITEVWVTNLEFVEQKKEGQGGGSFNNMGKAQEESDATTVSATDW